MPDYTTREMMDAIDQTPPVRTFLQKTFSLARKPTSPKR